MQFIESKSEFKNLRPHQLEIDLKSPRFSLSDLPKSQNQAEEIISKLSGSESLKDSINKNGILEPLIVTKLEKDKYNKDKDTLDKINNYFNVKLATVLRDKKQNFIPNSSTINRKNSNLFGSITNKFSDNINIGYNFSLDNNFHTLEYNEISLGLSNDNIVTTFQFIEENGERGDASSYSTSIKYEFNEENFLTFKTRRNRKINFTEYYDLVYQYKNDCLTAGVKYHKKYYSSGDLRPKQNLLFTITLLESISS